VRPGAALLDQPVAHRARQRDVGERAALAGVVQVSELTAPDLEHRAAEARLGGELDTLPARDLVNHRIHEFAAHASIIQPQVHLKASSERWQTS
jgi:hypothetical protein